MYHLITFPAGFGEASFSPFCIKAVWLLNFAGVDWVREDASDPRKMPRGKLPVLRDGVTLVHDSGNIANYLATHGTDFWGDTAPRDRAFGLGLIKMAEQDLYFHQALDRWGDDAVWPVVRDTYFSAIPRVLRGLITGKLRKGLLTALHRQGFGRMTPSERFADVDASLIAIANVLDGRAFLMGDRLTLPDFSVAAMLAGMAASPVPTALSRRVGGDAALMGYIGRVKAQVA